MKTPQDFANAIIAAADQCLIGEVSVEEHCAANKLLWDKVRALGFHAEVSAILKAVNEQEFQKAMERL